MKCIDNIRHEREDEQQQQQQQQIAYIRNMCSNDWILWTSNVCVLNCKNELIQ